MIKLTAPNGAHIDVNPAHIAAVYPNDTATFHPNAKSVVIIDGMHRGVQETVEEIEALTKD